jgi:glycosyltransferase involved in cell wall biosynthesis
MNKPKRYRIGLDARFYGPAQKGIGRYEQEVVDRLTRDYPQYDYAVFLGAHNFAGFKPAGPHVRKVLADIRWYTLKEQIMMPYLVKKEGVDLMHYLHFNVPMFWPGRFVVTIHDLILTKHATRRATTLSPWLYWLKNQAYRLAISRAARRSERIITISKYSRGDIVREFGVSKAKIALTYEGVADSLREAGGANDKKTLLGYNISKDFLLYVGNAYPHKNLELIIDIWPRVKAKHPRLQFVFVGKADYFYNRLKDLVKERGLDQDIVFAGFVPDADLAAFYRQARAYVFPSLFEGFGLPPLEAMRQECPVLSSNMTCLPEVLGPAALYFDPHSPDELASAINRVLSEPSLRAHLRAQGLARAELYSWDDCVAGTAGVYEGILGA